MRRSLLLAAVLALPKESAADFQPAAFDSFENRSVSRIAVTGNRITRPYVIWREIETEAGRPLRVSTLAGDVARLHDLGIFGEVNVAAASDSGGVAIEYEVRETPWIVPAPALSYSDANGWSYGVSVSSVNLAGRDIKFSGKALFGGTTTFIVDLVDPWISGNHLGGALYVAGLDREDVLDGFQEKSVQVTPTVGTWVGKHGRVRALFTWFEIHSNVPGKTLSPTDTDRLHRLGAGIGYDSRNSPRYTTSGWFLDLDATRTGGPLGGDGNFWTTNLDLRRYQPLGGDQSLMIAGLLSLQTGTVGVTFPEYLQFRMGGENSIRGYDLDSSGAVNYGQHQVIGTLEYQVPVVGQRAFRLFRWSFRLGMNVAAFCDQGIAWSGWDDSGLGGFQVGGGVGLRFLAPGVDVIRLDFAVGGGGGIKIGVAAQPKVTAQRRRIR